MSEPLEQRFGLLWHDDRVVASLAESTTGLRKGKWLEQGTISRLIALRGWAPLV